jgi:cellulose 1,4-beta-cellobiosidase
MSISVLTELFLFFTGRNGVQPTQQSAWGDWCNVKGTGFGVRPTTDTGDALEDAFVWVKPGGESDGTSDSSSARYDAHCGYSDALQPAPEAGTWFQVWLTVLCEVEVFWMLTLFV